MRMFPSLAPIWKSQNIINSVHSRCHSFLNPVCMRILCSCCSVWLQPYLRLVCFLETYITLALVYVDFTFNMVLTFIKVIINNQITERIVMFNVMFSDWQFCLFKSCEAVMTVQRSSMFTLTRVLSHCVSLQVGHDFWISQPKTSKSAL